MLLFFKKKTEEVSPVATDLPPAENREFSDYVPYYSHINPYTLLTKNGEVMQILRIRLNNQGLNYESAESDEQSVRAHIRNAITEVITTDNYSLWVHTIRRRHNLRYTTKVDDPFAAYVNEEWQRKHHWQYQYYNEIYVSILHTGQSGELVDKNAIQHIVLPKPNRQYRNQYIDQAAHALTQSVDAILDRIRIHYRAERLSLAERSAGPGQPAIFYSEPMEFLGKLLNLRTEPFPISETDISKAITTHAITFGFNALETKSAGGQRRFAALLSLKQYREVTPETADRLLQSPVECIVSQAFVFAHPKRALKNYLAQKDMFQLSGDTYSPHASGLEEMLENNHDLPTDFGDVQTTVMVLTDDYKTLDEEVHKVQEAFGDMGLITVREDIKIEECFWSQLPGNFEFIRRKDVIPTPRVAGFARLNLFPDGRDSGNHWGDAVALIPTQVNSPYFFNFHLRDNGHTFILDFNAFRDAMGYTLSNFLLTATRKFNARTYVFDRQRSAQLMFDKINGKYHRFQTALRKTVPNALHLNPLSLEDTPRNRGFLLAWCQLLVEPHTTLTDEHRAIIEAAIVQTYAAPETERNFGLLLDAVAAADYKLAGAFRLFVPGGKYAGVFDATTEALDLGDMLHAFDMESALKSTPFGIALFSYLLHRIIGSLNGSPAIIVLHEVFDLVDNAFFAPRLESLLEMLKQNNVMVLATTQHPQNMVNKPAFKILCDHCPTQLFIPDDITSDYTTELPMLTERDSKLMQQMHRQKGDFLLKQNDESISLRVNLDGMEDVRAIFAGDIKTLIAAGGRFATLPKGFGDAEDVA